jgi:glycosyltransferase involved in cell wall biosynthesis
VLKAYATLITYSALTVVLIVCAVIVADISPTSFLLIGIILVLMIPMAFRAARGCLDLFEPLVLANIAFGVMFFMRPLAVLITGNTVHLGYDVLPTFNEALVVALVGIVFFQVGYFFPLGAAWARRLPQPSSFNPKRAVRAGWLFFILGALLFGAFLSSAGGIVRILFYLLEGRQPSNNDLYLSSTGYLYGGISLWVATALIFFASATAGRRRGYIFPFIVVTLLLFVFYGAQGTRSQILPLVLAVPVFWFLWKGRRPKLRTLLVASLIGFALLGWMREVRNVGKREDMLTKLGSALASPPREAVNILTGADADMFDSLANALAVVPEQLPFQHGATVTDILIRIVPRPLWPDKPLESNDALVDTLWPVHYSHSRSAPAFSLIGPFYADSGIVTVALGMVLIGVLLAMLWCWLQLHQSNVVAQLIYSMGLPFALILMRGSIPSTLALMLFTFFPLALLMPPVRSCSRITRKSRRMNHVGHTNQTLCINTSFSEMDYLAGESAQRGLLSRYIRPYTNKGRIWERAIASIPGAGDYYSRTFGRRRLPEGLPPAYVREAAVALDVAMALVHRFVGNVTWNRQLKEALMHARTQAIANAGARLLHDECAVVASGGCAEKTFRRMKTKTGLCILNYPLAHHRFTRKLLLEEAELEPAFAGTLNSHDLPKWLEERLDEEIALADHILVGSSFVRESFVKEGIPAEKLEVIPYGTDTRLFEPVTSKPQTDCFKLLFIGQIGQRKGISYLVRAYKQFRDPKTSLTLVGKIQGDGSAFHPYGELFRHIDHVPHTYLRDIYQQADVFVFPTLVEGMPLVVLEAMASGLPIITTPNGPSDIVRDGVDGFIVPIRDPDSILEKLEYLRANPGACAEMGVNARRRALEFTWCAYQKRAGAVLQSWINTVTELGVNEVPRRSVRG